MFKEIKKGGL